MPFSISVSSGKIIFIGLIRPAYFSHPPLLSFGYAETGNLGKVSYGKPIIPPAPFVQASLPFFFLNNSHILAESLCELFIPRIGGDEFKEC